ncbi:DUF4129 domain-containing protein [Psychroflexus salis]|uniref:DUF4129 domain-containing protein n=1 Tax=Psychroflexus salis TaxID=1526574 RepID=UPI001662FB10|nr:DUF4129 domain-containing protein [Psychroflexus salis]
MVDKNSIDKSLEIKESVIQEIKSKSEFDYQKQFQQESWWDDFTEWLNGKWKDLLQAIFGDIEPDSFVYFVTQILPYLILGLVIIFIIWLFIKLNPGQNVLAEPKRDKVYFSNEEELIKTKDLNKLKADAMANNNFRLAVRYWYLLILKDLDDLELIAYEFEKTNSDYAQELQNLSFANSFKQTTNYYNFAWYGGFDVNELQFQKIDRLFIQLQQQINKKHE